MGRRVWFAIESDTRGLATLPSELGDFYNLAKLHELCGDLLLLQECDSLRLASIGRRGSLGVALGADLGEDTSTLDTLSEASKDAEVVLVGAFDDLDIDVGLHCRATLTRVYKIVYK